MYHWRNGRFFPEGVLSSLCGCTSHFFNYAEESRSCSCLQLSWLRQIESIHGTMPSGTRHSQLFFLLWSLFLLSLVGTYTCCEERNPRKEVIVLRVFVNLFFCQKEGGESFTWGQLQKVFCASLLQSLPPLQEYCRAAVLNAEAFYGLVYSGEMQLFLGCLNMPFSKCWSFCSCIDLDLCSWEQ